MAEASIIIYGGIDPSVGTGAGIMVTLMAMDGITGDGTTGAGMSALVGTTGIHSGAHLTTDGVDFMVTNGHMVGEVPFMEAVTTEDVSHIPIQGEAHCIRVRAWPALAGEVH